jgi:hypothetical protein
MEHYETIVGYVNKAIALLNCYTLFISVIESIHGKPPQKGV